MISKQQAPQIRFIGFSDDWVQRELGHIAQFSKGSGYSKADLRVEGSPIILYGRLYTKYQTVIDKVDTFVDEKVNSIKSQGNEVIVPASGETAEDIARASAVKQKGIILGGDLNIVRLNDSYSPTFIALKISHGKSKSELAKKAQGKSVVHIRNSDLQSLLLKIPTFKEQTDIGNLFQNIDQTIALQRRKHEQTQTLKKSLLSKMFPQKGQKQPEIRLEGFSGDWCNIKLGEILSRQMKGRAQFDKLSKGTVEYLDADRLNKSTIFLCDGEQDVFISDILIIWDGSNAGKVYRGFEGALGSTLKSYRVNEMYSAEFVYQHLSKDEKVIFQEFRTPNIPHVVKNFADTYQITVPELEEQTAIGQFFKQLDDTISLQAKQLKSLDNLKKALLAKMFV